MMHGACGGGETEEHDFVFWTLLPDMQENGISKNPKVKSR